MADAHSALNTSHADLITSLSFSSSTPSLLASTSLDGWIRIHARTPVNQGNKRKNAVLTNGSSSNKGNDTAMTDDQAEGEENDPENVADADAGPAEEWSEIGGCRANEGPVWRAIWGPREYGATLLVSIAGSIVNVWETSTQQSEQHKVDLNLRATLVEARGSMRDVAFAPSEFGLKLAAIAADSHLRIYECIDPSSAGLATWTPLETIDLLPLPNTFYTPSSSSHGSQLHHHQQTQLIKGFDEQNRHAPLGPSGGSTASTGGHSSGASVASLGGRGAGRIESSGAWAVSYCSEAWWGECVAVSAGKEGLIRIINFGSSHWSQLVVLTPPSSSNPSPISTIAWAPSCGRSYHLIASGSRDGCVRIWRVTPSNETGSPWEASLAAEITEHMDGSSGGIGRVEWNITGTVLSTAGCDGVVRLWKASYSGEWRCLSNITVDGEDSNPPERPRR